MHGRCRPAGLQGAVASQAPGSTCLSAMDQGGNGTPDRPINDSKGCGGIMRVAPLGLIHWFDAHEAFDLGARTAALTHSHPSGFLSAAAFAGMIRDLIEGVGLAQAVALADSRLADRAGSSETRLAIKLAVTLAVEDPQPHGRCPRAWRGLGRGEALAIACMRFLRPDRSEKPVTISANHSGDSDSTASIAGQLWGSIHGLEGVPPAWVTSLDAFDQFVRLSPTCWRCPARSIWVRALGTLKDGGGSLSRRVRHGRSL